MELAKRIYSVTDAFPKTEMFGLQSQMRRAAVFELQTQMEIAGSRNLIEQKDVNDLMETSEEIARMLNGLLHTLDEG